MFEGMYSHIQKRPIRRNHILHDQSSLAELLESESLNESELIKSFIFELKSMLDISEASLLIERLFEASRDLTKVVEKYPNYSKISLNAFYQELSPIILQKYWERRKNPLKEETIERLFLESIHIAIEEEIYIWQEKIQ